MSNLKNNSAIFIALIAVCFFPGCIMSHSKKAKNGEKIYLTDPIPMNFVAGIEKCSLVKDLDQKNETVFHMRTEARPTRPHPLESYELAYTVDGEKVVLQNGDVEMTTCGIYHGFFWTTGIMEVVDFPITDSQIRQLTEAQSIVIEGYEPKAGHKPWTLTESRRKSIRRFYDLYVLPNENRTKSPSANHSE